MSSKQTSIDRLTELTAVYIREFQRWGDTALVIVSTVEMVGDSLDGDPQPMLLDKTVKLECDDGELKREQEYIFCGKWVKHPKYGDQFHATSFGLSIPHSRSAIISYLADAGEGLGFGSARAIKAWEIWGAKAVEHLRENWLDAAGALTGRYVVDPENMKKLSDRLKENQKLEHCRLELGDLLNGRGFPKTTIREAIKEWGAAAAATIRSDPFELLAKFSGCGFKRCDAMYLELGHDPAAMRRQSLAAWFAVQDNSDGHTWFPAAVAKQGVVDRIGGADVRPDEAVRLAVEEGEKAEGDSKVGLRELTTDGGKGPIVPVASANGSGCRWVAERRKGEHERELAELVAEAIGENETRWPE